MILLWTQNGGLSNILRSQDITELHLSQSPDNPSERFSRQRDGKYNLEPKGVKGEVCGLMRTYPAGVCAPLKPEKCYLFLPSPIMHVLAKAPGIVFGRLSNARARREFPKR